MVDSTVTNTPRQVIRTMAAAILFGSILTVCSPLIWSGYNSVTEYHSHVDAPRQPTGQRYYWRDHGGPFVNYRSHPTWPEIQTPKEIQINFLGIFFNFVFYVYWVTAAMVVLHTLMNGKFMCRGAAIELKH